MNSIQTENLNISPEICKNLDKAVFGGSATEYVTQKHSVYVSELKAKLVSLRPDFEINSNGAFHLYCWCERFIIEDGKNEAERRQANIESARTQSKAWDWPGLK